MSDYYLICGSRSYELDKIIYKIGSNINNDIVIHNPSVAEKRVSVIYKSDSALIILNHSFPGVLINGVKLGKKRFLAANDVISFPGKFSAINTFQ